MPTTSAPADSQRHPPGIYTLYFTEMWERMSYYGMRGLLMLYMTTKFAEGGLGWDEASSGAIYGLYTSAVYLVALAGGWIADRLLGAQRSVLAGGIIIALGHFTLALPQTQAFFAGLILVVLGTALLKPNATAIVGQLYPEGGARRDAGFTLFYMGVNLGAFIGPLICGYLGERWSWHYGFGAAGVGMVLGVIQYVLTMDNLGEAGRHPPSPSKSPGRDWAIVIGTVAVILVVSALGLTGVITIDPVKLAKYTGVFILSLATLWFAWAFLLSGSTVAEKKRLAVLLILFLASTVFWSGFEQVGTTMNLFGERYTDRVFFGWEMPASWFLSLNALLILILAVPVSALWLYLARRQVSPSIPMKFGAGLLLLAAGFVVMHFGSALALKVGQVNGLWIGTTYLLFTLGELFLSPVGLSAVTKLAPAKLTGQTVGIWFLGTSLGNLLAGQLASGMSEENVSTMPQQFMQVAFIAGGAGLLLVLCARWIKRLMPGID